MLPLYEAFLVKLMAQSELCEKAHGRKRGFEDSVVIQDCFLLINLISVVAPISSTILKAGRYYEDYQVFIDLNIQLCKEIQILYTLLKGHTDHLMARGNSSAEDKLVLEIINET